MSTTETIGKAADYYRRVSAMIAEGSTGQAAFAQVAKDLKVSAATVQTGYYREHRKAVHPFSDNTRTKRNGKAKAKRVVMPRVAPAHHTGVNATADAAKRATSNGMSELDILTANLSSAVDALREYTAREAGKVQRLREVLA